MSQSLLEQLLNKFRAEDLLGAISDIGTVMGGSSMDFTSTTISEISSQLVTLQTTASEISLNTANSGGGGSGGETTLSEISSQLVVLQSTASEIAKDASDNTGYNLLSAGHLNELRLQTSEAQANQIDILTTISEVAGAIVNHNATTSEIASEVDGLGLLVAAMDQELDRIEATAGALETAASVTQLLLTDLHTTVSQVAANTASSAELTTLNATASEISDDVAAVRTLSGSIDSSLNNIETETQNLHSTASDIALHASSADSTLQTIYDTLGELDQSTLYELVTNIDNETTQIRSEVNSIDSRVTTLNSTASEIASTANKIELRLETIEDKLTDDGPGQATAYSTVLKSATTTLITAGTGKHIRVYGVTFRLHNTSFPATWHLDDNGGTNLLAWYTTNTVYNGEFYFGDNYLRFDTNVRLEKVGGTGLFDINLIYKEVDD